MKDSKKILDYLVKSLVLILILISFSFIYDNYRHSTYINDNLIVTNNDVYLKEYKKNLNAIKNNLDNYQYSESKYKDNYEKMNLLNQKLNSCYLHLTNDKGIYKLEAGKKITYYDIYELNNNVYNHLINDCWVTNLNKIDMESSYFNKMNTFQNNINMILSNSKNLKNRLLSNSLYSFGSINSKFMVYNPLRDSYDEVTRIYDDTSKIVLDMSNYLVAGEEYENNN